MVYKLGNPNVVVVLTSSSESTGQSLHIQKDVTWPVSSSALGLQHWERTDVCCSSHMLCVRVYVSSGKRIHPVLCLLMGSSPLSCPILLCEFLLYYSSLKACLFSNERQRGVDADGGKVWRNREEQREGKL